MSYIGDDIEVWSMKSLEDIVNKYKESASKVNESDMKHDDDGCINGNYREDSQIETPFDEVNKGNSNIVDDSIEDDQYEADVLIRSGSIPVQDRNSGMVNNSDIISRGVMPQKSMGNENQVYVSENERRRKELLARAMEWKKATIVSAISI